MSEDLMHSDEFQIDKSVVPESLPETPVNKTIQPETPAAETIATFKKYAKQTYSLISRKKLTTTQVVNLPANLDREAASALDKIPNINVTDNPNARKWVSVLSESLSYNTMGEVFVKTLQNPDSEFQQEIVHNNKRLLAASPQFTEIKNTVLTGERANIRIMNYLGMGHIFQVPLWNSGLWITFKPPTESELIELNRQLLADKITFGRKTYGLAFSNTIAYTVDRVVDFALAHIYETNVKKEDLPLEKLKSEISCQDLNSLIWGFICTMYPSGFNYRTACISNPDKCQHVFEETLNVSKLQWANNAALNDWQKTHMSVRSPRSRDIASLNRYKEELKNSQSKRIPIKNEMDLADLFITIKTPSIQQHIESGQKWISSIVDNVESLGTQDLSINEKNDLITNHAQASSLSQYSHWIDSIDFDTNSITDRETIDKTLETLSADDTIRVSVISAVIDYINNSTISVIGIPVHNCPACGTEQVSEISDTNPIFSEIIPLDVIQLFFALITQRLDLVRTR